MPIAPVNKLKKKEIEWLGGHYCTSHGHTYLEHYNCFLQEVAKGKQWNLGKEKLPVPQNIGFFDIENFGFKADFGILLSYCIKDSESDNILGRAITKKELDTCGDEKLVGDCVKDLKKFDRIVGFYSCVTPGHKVLRSDFTWVPVETLKKGDKLIAFSEFNKGHWCSRAYEESTVVENIPTKANIYSIELEDGTYLESTGNHPWLVKRNGYWVWRSTEELLTSNPKSHNSMQRILPIWEPNSTYESGYLSAFIDGEGCVSQHMKRENVNKHHKNLSVSFAQSAKKDFIINKLTSCLDKLNYTYSVRSYDPTKKHMVSVSILGSRAEKLKFLGETRPAKISNIDINSIGGVKAYSEEIPIKKVTFLGESTVMGLGTTSSTYIVNGFGSHNTKHDVPFVRSRAVFHKIPFPSVRSMLHTDVYYIIKHKFKLSRNSQQTAYNILVGESHKTHWGRDNWIKAIRGDKESLTYIFEHNKIDVLELEELFYAVDEFSLRTDRSI